jgi:cardiolipin synthase (CMP-forming)
MAEPTNSSRGLAGEEIPEGEDRILTLPNFITLVRALCIPLFLWLLFGRDNRFGAAVLLAALGATDWVDGYAARRLGQVSNLGKMFDPTVDRLLMVVGIAAIMLHDLQIDWFMPFAWVVVVREVVLSAFVVLTIALGARRMDVTWVGKAGTFAMMVAFPSFLASADQSLPDGVQTAFLVLAWAMAIPGLVLSMIAFFGYLPAGIKALREGRQMRATRNAG